MAGYFVLSLQRALREGALMAVWPNGLKTKPDFTSLYLGYPGHYGLDMKNFDINYAVLGGTVVTSGWSPTGGGYMVEILADNGDLHRYLHNAKGLLVSKGQRVETGQALAYQGNSGLSFGKHLHFAVRLGGIGGSYTDPLPYLKALVGPQLAGGEGTTIDESNEEEEEEEEEEMKPFTIGIKNKNKTSQFALISADLKSFVPIWTVDTINMLGEKNNTWVTYVAKDEWNGFRTAAGLPADNSVG